MKKRKILVTAALPYANGEIHLGHLVEHIQTDIWVRQHQLHGHDCLFICGSDAHGTPIMLAAQKAKLSPEALIEKINKDHQADFKQFFINYDNYYTTHSEENKKLAELIYQRLKDNNDICTKTITQAYDEQEHMFLPDRFVKGTCPKCKTADQYGDNCEKCGASYSPTDLKNAVSVLSGVKPIEKESEHVFFKLNHYQDFLSEWIKGDHLQSEVSNKLQEWFADDLRDWDISRDEPYFGFQIPGTDNKYFYVWLDAPIGYMASTEELANRNSAINFGDYWQVDSDAELYHFIGKDIMYFHALFWPAMLKGANFRLPNGVFVHGYLTVNGEKMSKSRGTFITAKTYLKHFNPEYLRYYYAAKLNDQVEDIDLNLQDFAQRVNSDLVGKYVNLASRNAGFITKKSNGILADSLDDEKLFADFVAAGKTIFEHFESRHFGKAVREIMALADKANQYIDQHKPWVLAKEEGREADVQRVCTQGLNLFKILTAYLKPILPITAEKVEAFLNIEPLDFENINTPLLNHKINKFKPLLQRINDDDLETLRTARVSDRQPEPRA